MAMEKITAKVRTVRGTQASRRLRREGRIPANMYSKGTTPTALTIDRTDFHRLIRHHGESSLITLAIDGGEEQMAIYKNVDVDPLNTKVLHVDFQAVRAGETVSISVPVRLIGSPIGVTDQGGVLMQSRNEITIACIPKLIPDFIPVEISELELHGSIHLRDLTLPEGLELDDNTETTLVSIIETRAIVAEETEEVEGEEGAEGAEPAEGEAAAATTDAAKKPEKKTDKK